MGYWMGPRPGLEPQTQFLLVIFGRPATNTFTVLTELRIQVIAANNTISLGISTNVVSNTLPPISDLYISWYDLAKYITEKIISWLDFIKYDSFTTGLWTRYWTLILSKDRESSLPTRFKPSLLSNQSSKIGIRTCFQTRRRDNSHETTTDILLQRWKHVRLHTSNYGVIISYSRPHTRILLLLRVFLK